MDMPEEDKEVILRFAAGDQSAREEAIAAHRRNIDTVGVRGTLEQDFMAEIYNPCPDLALRGRYREKLLKGAP